MTTEDNTVKQEVKLSSFLQSGLVILEKLTAKEMTLTKNEMVDLLNFETAVKFIIDAEQKAEASKVA